MSQSSSSSSQCSSVCRSNLQRFLGSVTPIITSSSVSEDCNSLQANGSEILPLLRLKNIWESFDEWSSCGVGTPVMLENDEPVMQYYVPYLSAIQVFLKKSPPTVRNNKKYENETVRSSESESLSDDSESSSKTWDVASGDSWTDPLLMDCYDNLYFQFYECCSPYDRIPFVEKIVQLSEIYPGLMTLKISDISPASWMSVAWYPIYHIPAKGKVKDLSTCFLTFHRVSPSFQDVSGEVGVCEEQMKGKSKEKGSLALAPFGLATYKMQGDLWNNRAMGDDERLSDLKSAAYSWLKKLNVPHHDFNFFTMLSTVACVT